MDLSFICELESAIPCHFAKGTYLIRQDDPIQYVYYLLEGSCERIEFSESGEEILFNTKISHGGLEAIVGLNNLWVPTETSFSSFVAKTDLFCYRVDAPIFKQEMQKHTILLDEIITMNLRNYLALRTLFKSRQERRTPNQVCALLLKHAITTDKGLYVAKKLSNVSISRQLGVHQVTVAKIMSFLQKEMILKRTSAGIQILDLSQLTDYAGTKKMDYLT